MSESKNASKPTTLSATLVSYLKRIVSESSESSFTVQQIKKTALKGSLALLFIISGMVQLSAQKVGDKASIKTKEGNTIYGTLITLGDSIVSIETAELGLVSLTRTRIAKLRPAIFRPDGSYWFENPNATRNLLSPTGFGLRKGEGNYQNTMLILQIFNYGFTDHLSIGAGFEILSLFASNGSTPYLVLAPKISTASNAGINTAAGLIFVHSSGDDDLNATIPYSATTLGNRDNNFTGGVAFVKNEDGWLKGPVISLSAMGRVNKKFSLVTENLIITDRGDRDNNLLILLSGGGRFMAPSITVDFALVLSATESQVAFPWLSVTLPFGK